MALGFADSDIAMVILPYYAVLFMIAVPLVLLPTPALVTVGTAVAVGMPFLSHAVRAELPQTTGLNHSFVDLLTDPVGMLQELLLTGAYPALSWATYVCAGIVVGRLRLQSSKAAAGLLFGGAVAHVRVQRGKGMGMSVDDHAGSSECAMATALISISAPLRISPATITPVAAG